MSSNNAAVAGFFKKKKKKKKKTIRAFKVALTDSVEEDGKNGTAAGIVDKNPILKTTKKNKKVDTWIRDEDLIDESVDEFMGNMVSIDSRDMYKDTLKVKEAEKTKKQFESARIRAQQLRNEKAAAEAENRPAEPKTWKEKMMFKKK